MTQEEYKEISQKADTARNLQLAIRRYDRALKFHNKSTLSGEMDYAQVPYIECCAECWADILPILRAKADELQKQFDEL